MIGIWLFQKYLNRLDDYKFTNFWETKFIGHTRGYSLTALIYFVVGFGLIFELLMIGNESVFFAVIAFLFLLGTYGIFIRSILRFLALNNQRYLQIKGGFQTETFNRDNVVG